MVNFAKPVYSKSQLGKVGNRIRTGEIQPDDESALANFRGSHAYVLNTFQANIRNHSKTVTCTVGQRLKRRNTIVDKLKREPRMALPRMHDIAGCRIVFENIGDLHSVRESMHGARWKHSLTHDTEKYDYIKYPRSSGYRGIHDVYRYNVSSSTGQAWNGLNLEIQYRTRCQHAWATAVEVADLIESAKIKFSDAADTKLRYFKLASEIIARTAESKSSCCADLENTDLKRAFQKLDDEWQLLETFKALRESSNREVEFKRNTLLVFRFGNQHNEQRLEIKTFKNVNRAVEAYNALELELGNTADIVLVRGENEKSIRDTFRNYFSDAKAFVELIEHGLKEL